MAAASVRGDSSSPGLELHPEGRVQGPGMLGHLGWRVVPSLRSLLTPWGCALNARSSWGWRASGDLRVGEGAGGTLRTVECMRADAAKSYGLGRQGGRTGWSPSRRVEGMRVLRERAGHLALGESRAPQRGSISSNQTSRDKSQCNRPPLGGLWGAAPSAGALG